MKNVKEIIWQLICGLTPASPVVVTLVHKLIPWKRWLIIKLSHIDWASNNQFERRVVLKSVRVIKCWIPPSTHSWQLVWGKLLWMSAVIHSIVSLIVIVLPNYLFLKDHFIEKLSMSCHFFCSCIEVYCYLMVSVCEHLLHTHSTGKDKNYTCFLKTYLFRK